MRLPRDLSGGDLIKALEIFGYRVTRQGGSHVRMTTQQRGEHHITIPQHATLRLGTMASILGDVSQHFEMSRQEILRKLFAGKR